MGEFILRNSNAGMNFGFFLLTDWNGDLSIDLVDSDQVGTLIRNITEKLTREMIQGFYEEYVIEFFTRYNKEWSDCSYNVWQSQKFKAQKKVLSFN